MSRAALSRVTGLSSAGVTKLTAQMDQLGLLREVEQKQERSLGRPAIAVALRTESRAVLAVHMGAGRVHLAVSNLALDLVEERGFEFDLSTPVETVLKRTTELARDAVHHSGLPMSRFVGTGIGVPGGVDPAHRVNTNSIITGWKDIAFADAFEDALGLPATVEHNATAIAMAEACYGENRTAESILYVLLGKGTGGGFAQTDPAPRRRPVEIGHIAVEPGGRACRCGGQGCLEMFFSEEPLRELAGSGDVSPDELIAAAMKSPEWPRIYEYILLAFSTSVTLLAPRRVILGGFLNTAPETFLAALRRDLPPRVMPHQRTDLRIEQTSLPEPVGVRGAACIALEKFFFESGPGTASQLLMRRNQAD
jgi:predicted NBD/HSP70 family sugar kinase